MNSDETLQENALQRPSAPFWPWALSAYSQPRVAPALIALQEDAGLSVNLVLWCCWCAPQFDAAPESAIRTAISQTQSWRDEVTAPLRNARSALKSFAGAADYPRASSLRAMVKAGELAAERCEIEQLERLARRLLAPPADGAADSERIAERARRNAALYAALEGAAKRKGFSTSLLHQVIDNIFA
ncbi:MAG: TIGR02444 family protein [Pseudomonadota bacterium]